MTEQERQSAKEQAVLLALQHDQALIRRDLEIHSMNKDGSTEFVSQSNNYDDLWQEALQTLHEKYRSNTITHYICTGGCNGVSETPGTCQAENCTKHEQELTACDCANGKHGKE